MDLSYSCQMENIMKRHRFLQETSESGMKQKVKKPYADLKQKFLSISEVFDHEKQQQLKLYT